MARVDPVPGQYMTLGPPYVNLLPPDMTWLGFFPLEPTPIFDSVVRDFGIKP